MPMIHSLFTPETCRRKMTLASSLWKPISFSDSPAAVDSGILFRRPVTLATVVSPPETWLKIKGQKSQKLQVLDSEHVSRRKTMLYLTSGVLGGLIFLSGEAAEARVGRQENRRKAMEKLRERTKASGQKSGNQKKEGSPPPVPQEQAIGPLVEASLTQ